MREKNTDMSNTFDTSNMWLIKMYLKKISHRKILHIDGIFELAIRMCTIANSVR